MKPYTEFVMKVFDCVSESFVTQENKLRIFAEGVNSNYSGSQEYAILRNDAARLFHSVLSKNAEVFNADLSDFRLKESSIYPEEVKIVHSCYPKNLRRWLNGTISRKKSCRIEFCVLAWCHVVRWDASFEEERVERYDPTQQKLLCICNEYLGSQDKQLSVDLLWKASCNTYRRSFF